VANHRGTSAPWSKAHRTSTSAPNCVDLAHNIHRQEKRKLTSAQPLFNTIPSPRQVKEFLDQYVVGQDRAKRSLSVAVHTITSD